MSDQKTIYIPLGIGIILLHILVQDHNFEYFNDIMQGTTSYTQLN